MFSNTFNNLKQSFKKGADFVKTFTIGTITSLKNDICEEIEVRKEVKELRKAKKASNSSEKPE
jgi:hypothetical protein